MSTTSSARVDTELQSAIDPQRDTNPTAPAQSDSDQGEVVAEDVDDEEWNGASTVMLAGHLLKRQPQAPSDEDDATGQSSRQESIRRDIDHREPDAVIDVNWNEELRRDPTEVCPPTSHLQTSPDEVNADGRGSWHEVVRKRAGQTKRNEREQSSPPPLLQTYQRLCCSHPTRWERRETLPRETP